MARGLGVSLLACAMALTVLIDVTAGANYPPPRKHSPPGPACLKQKLYRYYSLTKYAAGADVAAIIKFDAENVAAKCKTTFVRGYYGADLGQGVSFYNSTANWHTAKILDFKSMDDLKAYKACQKTIPDNLVLDTMGNVTGKAKVIVPLANACPETAVNVNWLMTIFMYNMTGKPATKEILTEIGDNVNRAVEPVRPCLLAHPVIEMDMGWASALGETDWTTPGGVYQAIGGGSEMLTINRMRAYWSYLIGPPRDAYLTLAVAGIAGAIRMQINSTAI